MRTITTWFNLGNLSDVAIKAFQELSAKNDALETKIKALESAG